MATFRSTPLLDANNPERVREWAKGMAEKRPQLDALVLEKLCLSCLAWQKIPGVSPAELQHGLNMADILADLNLDLPTVMAALCYNTVRAAKLDDEALSTHLSPEVIGMIRGVTRMDAVHALRAEYDSPEQTQQQTNNVRHMLLAMVEDVRLVLIKLAEQLCLLEAATEAPVEQQKNLARLAREIFAPLANRLGVGHLKWQLEDWAFRYLESSTYKHIASLIAEKRLDRQKAVDEVIEQLTAALKEDGIQAQVNGRVKHIYSIWNKMRRKNIQYEEVYDVRALRILVDKISDCYGALGTVHRLWMHIPKEFDDYIAQPKANGYRSLHTAVVGPGGKALEVQIRTHEMHEESELGVCAHWAYKESASTDPKLQNKIKWLRSLLEWQEEVTRSDDVLSEWQKTVTEDRVYVFTPKGDVIDLPKGSTPLDYAYHLHTELGHRSRGAKINGRIVPLTYQLNTSDQIEILTQKEASPGRDWINPDSGYIYTSRARAKARSWFKLQHRDENIHEGRLLLDKELQRLNLPPLDLNTLAHRFNFTDPDDIYAALGRGDLRLGQVLSAAKALIPKQSFDLPEALAYHPTPKMSHESPASDTITIEGVGNLLTTMAGCCHALPGDPIIGYITLGRGVSIHRQDCPNILQAQSETPERVIAVDWGKPSESLYEVSVAIFSYDRKNLLRDITSLLAHETVNVLGIDSHSDKNSHTVKTLITLEVPDLAKLARVLGLISQLPNVISAQRVHQESPK
jgi:GTP pyrophosphokinase